MTDQIERLQAVLENKRDELARSIRLHTGHLTISDGEHELMDQLQSMCRRDEAVAFLDTLTRTLADVNAALAAIKEGSYGTCIECDEPIAPKRLVAIPWASHCIRCQEAIDDRNASRATVARWDQAA
jgi:DnaK suppressor protein